MIWLSHWWWSMDNHSHGSKIWHCWAARMLTQWLPVRTGVHYKSLAHLIPIWKWTQELAHQRATSTNIYFWTPSGSNILVEKQSVVLQCDRFLPNLMVKSWYMLWSMNLHSCRVLCIRCKMEYSIYIHYCQTLDWVLFFNQIIIGQAQISGHDLYLPHRPMKPGESKTELYSAPPKAH